MILRTRILSKIRTGEVSLAFRKWKRPTVKEGGTLLTPIGQLKITALKKITIGEIKNGDLDRAGITDVEKEKFLAYLMEKEGDLFRIEFELAGEDPRIALRNNDDLDPAEMKEILAKLKRMDVNSAHGPWIKKVMEIIEEHPKTRAQWIADQLGYEKDWMKTNIRKLKSLGLTISHEIGYEVSPRGKKVFEAYLD